MVLRAGQNFVGGAVFPDDLVGAGAGPHDDRVKTYDPAWVRVTSASQFQAKADDRRFVAMINRAPAETRKWNDPDMNEVILSVIASTHWRTTEMVTSPCLPSAVSRRQRYEGWPPR